LAFVLSFLFILVYFLTGLDDRLGLS